MSSEDKKAIFRYYWRVAGSPYPLVEEYRFMAELLGPGKGLRGRLGKFDHDWRLDFLNKESLVAVEINGNAWHVRGGGRHGKDEDLMKINRAQDLGYMVFQFSPQLVERQPEYCVGIVARNIERRLNDRTNAAASNG